MMRNIHHFAISVQNFERMIKFYQDAFGYEIVGNELDFDKLGTDRMGASTSQPIARVIMMKTGNCFLEIMEAPRQDKPSEGQMPRGYWQMSVEIDNLDEEFPRLQKLGLAFEQPAPVDFGYVKAVTGRDPEGNVIELVERIGDWDCNLTNLLANAR